MRKIILTSLLVTIISTGLLAQTIEEIRDLVGKNQWVKAKEGIDKYLSNDKNTKKGDGWYLKAVIYNGIVRDSILGPKSPAARMDAFNAYKKYLEVDAKAIEGQLSQHATLFDVSFGYLQTASETFNAKKFDESLTAFKNAEIVEDYIVKKQFVYGNFSFPAYDTQLYVNIAAAAVNAKKEDIALEYYQKLADKKIVDKGFDEIYKYVVNQFVKKGDTLNRDKYLAIGKELYPKDEYWCLIGINEDEKDKKKLFAQYDALMNSSCSSYAIGYNYAVEIYNYCFAQEKHPDDFTTIHPKLPEVLKKTIAINSTPEANMLMCRYHFGLINDQLDVYNAMKGAKPEDLKKRADINNQINQKYEDVYPYAMSVYNAFDAKPDLKPGEKGSFKVSCSMLSEYWERKKDNVKMKLYQDKMASIK